MVFVKVDSLVFQAPNISKVRSKMVYASSKDRFKSFKQQILVKWALTLLKGEQFKCCHFTHMMFSPSSQLYSVSIFVLSLVIFIL
jgi:hypothetical protein